MNGSGGGCLGCERIAVAPMTLRNGTVVCNYCPAWLHECEVRDIANLGSKELQAIRLRKIAEKRGRPAAEALRDEVVGMVKELREAKAND